MLEFLRRFLHEEVVVESEFEVLEAAHREAQNRLPDFKERFRSEGDERSLIFRIKVAFPLEDEDVPVAVELLELDVTEWEDDVITGTVRDRPTYRTDLDKGKTIHVRESDVFDWKIIERGEGLVVFLFLSSEPEQIAPGHVVGANPLQTLNARLSSLALFPIRGSHASTLKQQGRQPELS